MCAQGEARKLENTARSLRAAFKGGGDTVHLMGHYDHTGSLCSPSGQVLIARESLVLNLITSKIRELVLYGCWAGTLPP